VRLHAGVIAPPGPAILAHVTRSLLACALLLAACPAAEGPFEGDDPGECADDADNDRDGLFDCEDPDCAGSVSCTGDDDDAVGDDDDDDASDDDDFTTDDDDAAEGAVMYAHTATALYEVDGDLDVRLVGSFNPPTFSAADLSGVADIAMDSDGVMYAIAWWELYRVDPRTAGLTHLTDIGSIGDEYNALTALADGRLVAGNGQQITVVDPSTGAVESTGSLASVVFAGDMVGLPDGLMYCLVADDTESTSPTSLAIWDPDTGGTLIVGATGQGAMFGVGYADSVLYGFNEGGDIFTIERLSGAATVARRHGIPFWGAATNPARWDTKIPE